MKKLLTIKSIKPSFDLLPKIPMRMRITSVLLAGFLFQANAETSYSQSARISIEMNNATIEDVLNEIEAKSEFLYNNKLINVDRRVSVDVDAENIESVLQNLFKGTDVVYRIADKQIVLSRKDLAQNTAIDGIQQSKVVTGTVVDPTGMPVIGANIMIKGTTNGTITDMDGNFSLEADKDAILVVSYIGFANQEIKVGNQSKLSIALKEDAEALDELVVVGYGTVKKANLGGAVSTDSKTFASRPIQNAASALQGEVPGLTITRTGGAPGSDMTMKVRDVSSINGGTPLVLIDGAEGNINMINPSDIENISVLKDGTAAIYGARASDGVILITTKSGKRNQKTTVAFDAYYSIKTPALLRKPANLLQHAEMALEITDGSFPIEYTKDELDLIRQNSDLVLTDAEWGRWTGYPKFYKDQDWNEMLIGNGNMQNYNVNISGGGERYSYMLSLGHQREEGIPKYGEDINKRYFVRAKSSVEIFKNLTYDLNLAYEASNRDYSSGLTEGQNIWELIYKTRSWTPMYNPSGTFYTFEGFDNPAQVLEEGGMVNKTTGNVTVNNQLKWNIFEGLQLVGQAVIRKYDQDENVTNKKIINYDWDNNEVREKRTPNSAERRYQKTLSKNFTLYADYKKNFADKHDLSIMVGTSHESENYDKFTAKRINFDQQENMSLQLGSSQDQSAWSEGNQWTINSFFSRINYQYFGKFLPIN